MDTLYYSCHIGILLIFDCLFHYRSSTSSVTKWYDCLWTPSAIMRTSSDAKILEYLHKQDKCYTKCCTLREASCLRELVEPFNIIYEKRFNALFVGEVSTISHQIERTDNSRNRYSDLLFSMNEKKPCTERELHAITK